MKFIFDPSLVLYLPLYKQDGSSFMSRDAFGHVCTVTGALWRPGGRYFDGSDDKIDCGTPAILDITDAITFEIWFKAKSLANWDSLGGRLAGATWANGGYLFYYLGNNLYFTVKYGTVTTQAAFNDTSNWHHAAGTYDRDTGDGQELKIFLDAVAGTTGNYTTAIDTGGHTKIGEAQSATYNWNGYVGEVRIYTRALTHQEIQHNYLATKWRYR